MEKVRWCVVHYIQNALLDNDEEHDNEEETEDRADDCDGLCGHAECPAYVALLVARELDEAPCACEAEAEKAWHEVDVAVAHNEGVPVVLLAHHAAAQADRAGAHLRVDGAQREAAIVRARPHVEEVPALPALCIVLCVVLVAGFAVVRQPRLARPCRIELPNVAVHRVHLRVRRVLRTVAVRRAHSPRRAVVAPPRRHVAHKVRLAQRTVADKLTKLLCEDLLTDALRVVAFRGEVTLVLLVADVAVLAGGVVQAHVAVGLLVLAGVDVGGDAGLDVAVLVVGTLRADAVCVCVVLAALAAAGLIDLRARPRRVRGCVAVGLLRLAVDLLVLRVAGVACIRLCGAHHGVRRGAGVTLAAV